MPDPTPPSPAQVVDREQTRDEIAWTFHYDLISTPLVDDARRVKLADCAMEVIGPLLAELEAIVRQDEQKRDALLADLDAAREALREERAKVAEYENTITWNTTCMNCATVLDSAIKETERREKAEAERDRMRPVVEKAQAAAKTNPHSAFPEVVRLRLAERAAVDTYETQEGTE